MRESRCMSFLPRTTLHSDSEQYLCETGILLLALENDFFIYMEENNYYLHI
jgi:hypothetical protein